MGVECLAGLAELEHDALGMLLCELERIALGLVRPGRAPGPAAAHRPHPHPRSRSMGVGHRGDDVAGVADEEDQLTVRQRLTEDRGTNRTVRIPDHH
jgi:hypothetical protein